jgi:Flp pilus assembly pilin Flp
MPRHESQQDQDMSDVSSKPSLRACVIGFIGDDRGATAIEYGVIVALISVAIMGAIFTTGSNMKTMVYDSIVNALKGG